MYIKQVLNFEYDKLFLKEITVLMPKYHTNINSFLTPLLGLYGVNTKEFVNEFENKTKFLTADVTVPVRVKISKIKTFELSIKTPYISTLFNNNINKNLLTLYKISLIKNINLSLKLVSNLQKTYKNVRLTTSLFKKEFSIKRHDGEILKFEKIKSRVRTRKSVDFLLKNQYGLIMFFNNVSSRNMNTVRTILSYYNVGIEYPDFSIPFLSSDWMLAASKNFNSLLPTSNLFKKNSSNFYVPFVIIRNNILALENFSTLFNKSKMSKQFLFINTMKFFIKTILTILFKLNRTIANVSSTFKKF